MSTLRAMPVIDVTDVVAAEAFWKRLGFASHGLWGRPPSFGIVQRGDVTIGLSRADDTRPLPVNHHWAAYIYVDDLDALHREFTKAGLGPTAIHRPDHYGCDDFDVIDPDGNRIAFGQARDPEPGPGLSGDRGKG